MSKHRPNIGNTAPRGLRLIPLSLPGATLAILVLVAATAYVTAERPTPRGGGDAAPNEAGIEEWVGQSVLHVRGACLDGNTPCVGEVTSEDGSFFLNAPAEGGHIMVSWRAVNESLATLKLQIVGVEIVGESPIRLELDGLAAGEHAIRAEPARRVAGLHDQVLDWTAQFAMTAPFETVETRGQSSYRIAAGCALNACDPLARFTSGKLVVPWRAQGTLAATWDPNDGPMRVTIPGTGFAAEGESPIELDVSGLTEGEWNVKVEPIGVGLPLSGASISWLAQLERE